MASDVLNVLMRWLHISSVAVLIGGFVFARLMLTASEKTLAADAGQALADRASTRFRPFALGAMTALVLSGIYNLLYSPGHTVRYQAMLAVKLLLVAHLFSVAVIVAKPGHPRRKRLITGAAISGLIVIAISAYLRRSY